MLQIVVGRREEMEDLIGVIERLVSRAERNSDRRCKCMRCVDLGHAGAVSIAKSVW